MYPYHVFIRIYCRKLFWLLSFSSLYLKTLLMFDLMSLVTFLSDARVELCPKLDCQLCAYYLNVCHFLTWKIQYGPTCVDISCLRCQMEERADQFKVCIYWKLCSNGPVVEVCVQIAQTQCAVCAGLQIDSEYGGKSNDIFWICIFARCWIILFGYNIVGSKLADEKNQWLIGCHTKL